MQVGLEHASLHNFPPEPVASLAAGEYYVCPTLDRLLREIASRNNTIKNELNNSLPSLSPVGLSEASTHPPPSLGLGGGVGSTGGGVGSTGGGIGSTGGGIGSTGGGIGSTGGGIGSTGGGIGSTGGGIGSTGGGIGSTGGGIGSTHSGPVKSLPRPSNHIRNPCVVGVGVLIPVHLIFNVVSSGKFGVFQDSCRIL